MSLVVHFIGRNQIDIDVILLEVRILEEKLVLYVKIHELRKRKFKVAQIAKELKIFLGVLNFMVE